MYTAAASKPVHAETRTAMEDRINGGHEAWHATAHFPARSHSHMRCYVFKTRP